MKPKKVVCIVQARMSSSRLPGKVMRPILGKPMIGYTLKRLSKCETITETVLATSIHQEDSCLYNYAGRLGFDCFMGNLDNVLERYVFANRKYGGDVVIRVTGDCPLIDPGVVDFTVRTFLDAGKDYVSFDIKNSGMNGFNTEVFSAEALERTYEVVEKLEDYKNYKEHVTIYMYRHPDEFSIGKAYLGEELKRHYRLCVDEIDDFRVVEAIYNNFRHPYPTMKEIVDFLDKHPEIASINKHVKQKKA